MAISFTNDPLIATTVELGPDKPKTVFVFGVEGRRALVLDGNQLVWWELDLLLFELSETETAEDEE